MEIELKLRIREPPDLSNYKKIYEGIEVDTYYNHPCRDFSRTDEALRIRRRTGFEKAILTYKGPRAPSKVKIREEIELEVDEDKAKKLLERLGFKPIAVIKKRREVYIVDGAYVTIDRVEGIGLFMEIEAESEEKVLSVWKKLGKIGEIEEKTYLELFLLHHRGAFGNLQEEVDERN